MFPELQRVESEGNFFCVTEFAWRERDRKLCYDLKQNRFNDWLLNVRYFLGLIIKNNPEPHSSSFFPFLTFCSIALRKKHVNTAVACGQYDSCIFQVGLAIQLGK